VPPYGTWSWIATQTEPDVYVTPDDVGYTRALVFAEDLGLTEYRDGDVYRTGTYTFYDYYWYLPGEIVEVFFIIETHFTGEDTHYSYDIGNDGQDLFMCSGSHPATGYPWYPCEQFYKDDAVPAEPTTWSDLKARYR